jgi:molybdopterin-guanine dinucleotide biosynthesis protein A
MGQPKAWLPFGPELMLQRVVRILSDVVRPIVVVAAPDQEIPPLPPGVEIARDEERGRGPLEGLAAGLTHLQGRCDAAFLSSCDVPFLRPALVQRLIDLLGENDICVPVAGERHHPLAAVYRTAVLPMVRQLLKEDRLRPIFLFEALPTRVVTPDELAGVDPKLESFHNLNTPEDYAEALRRAFGGSPDHSSE